MRPAALAFIVALGASSLQAFEAGVPEISSRAQPYREPFSSGAYLRPLVGVADYPERAIIDGLQGNSRLMLSVDALGHITGCVAVGGSGLAILDEAGCETFRKKVTFRPAVSRTGQAMPDVFEYTIAWRLGAARAPILQSANIAFEGLPRAASSNGEGGLVSVQYTVGADGRLKKCAATGSSPEIQKHACNLMTKKYRFAPAVDAMGMPVEAGPYKHSIYFHNPSQRSGAIPTSDPRKWVAWTDLPVKTGRNAISGPVSIAWTVSRMGQAEDCRVVRTSGNSEIDTATCTLILKRAVYSPAGYMDNGLRVSHASTDSMTIDWLGSRKSSTPIVFHNRYDAWFGERTLLGKLVSSN